MAEPKAPQPSHKLPGADPKDHESAPKPLPAILGDPATRNRVDKWLWFARIIKSRSLAQSLIKSGKVRVNTLRINSPSHQVGAGDVLTVTLDRQIKILKVVAPGTRRGPAPESSQLYEDFSEPVPKRNPADRPARQAVREEGAGRPTKKERRQLSRFRAGAGEEF